MARFRVPGVAGIVVALVAWFGGVPVAAATAVTTPTISGVAPIVGPAQGGTTVTITGTNFTGATVVDFGSTPAVSFTVDSATSMTAVNPPGAGLEPITVTTPAGTAVGTEHPFLYAPAVTGISPAAGTGAGSTTVTVTGIGFDYVRYAYVGTAAASVTVDSDTTLTIRTPPGTGTVDITVQNSGGTSPVTPADRFTYYPPSTVTALSPDNGPPSGGTPVTITGTNFTGATAVDFGSTPAAGFTVDSPTSITAVPPTATALPPLYHNAVTAAVTVTVPVAGASAAVPAELYSYVWPPTLQAGQSLAANQALVSPDGDYRLVVQGSDGNLVLYQGNAAPWETRTTGHPGDRLVLQGSDGNLVLYDGTKVLWTAGTVGHPGDRLSVQADGNLVVYSTTNQALWESRTNVITYPDTDTLASGQSLTSTGWRFLWSPNARYILSLSESSDLVLQDEQEDAALIWTTPTSTITTTDSRLVMQASDGNLVLYQENKALWTAHTAGHPGDRLVLQSDGNLVVYSTTNTALWDTGTEGK